MHRNTVVLSRDAAKIIIPKLLDPFIWISIRDKAQEALQPTNKLCNDYIDLVFNDDSCSFTRDQATLIYDWLYKQDLDNEILINCHAGISRSAGIAAAIEETIFNNKEHSYFKQKVPNTHVYKTMLEVYHNNFKELDYLSYLINKQ